jgi:hypothetical protein
MRDHIAIGLLLSAVESTELAIDVADIRVIDVPVDDVGHHIIPIAPIGIGQRELPAVIGKCSQLLEREVVQFQRLLGGDALPLDHAVGQSFGNGTGHKERLEVEG